MKTRTTQTPPQAKPFQARTFVSVVLGLCLIILPITGLANHLLQGSIATAARHGWMAAHNLVGILCVGFAIWHAWLNRRALLRHLRRSGSRLLTMRREVVLGAALVAVILLVSAGHGARG